MRSTSEVMGVGQNFGEAFAKAQLSAGAHSFSDERVIRRTAIAYRVPCITTIGAAKAAAEAIASRRHNPVRVWSLQEIHGAG